MKITARDMARLIQDRVKPGEELAVSYLTLRDIPTGTILECDQDPVDLIMDSIVGAGNEWYVRQNSLSGNVVFGRLKEPLNDERRTWVEPVRRHLFWEDELGYWRLKQ